MATVCHELFREVTIHANGNVVCSCMDAEKNHVFGNVNSQSLYEIFHGKKYAELRNALLNSGDDSFCACHRIHCPFKATNGAYKPRDFSTLQIKKIRLETLSRCNLRCPACVVTHWYQRQGTDAEFQNRFARLPLETSKRILLEVKDTLKDLWLYNYGEPFLDKDLLNLCRFVRHEIPAAEIFTHTNATVIPDGWAEQISEERLFDHLSFSIDGVWQESYEKYRVRGDVNVALGNLRRFSKLRDQQPAENRVRLIWQYILFDWNDSRAELRQAQELAEDMGVEIQWILTHTDGKSARILPDSAEYAELQGVHHYSGQLLAERLDDEK
jgi:wyosine [tRNA(Phe)-imidazoG37] synthetase (radical SAM superfamily)